MDYEKKYKDALERAEKALEVLGTDKCEGARQIFSLFPELAESEDEKIRNWLIGYFHQYQEDGMEKYANGLKVESIFAWLEKQGEKNLANKVEHLIPQKGVYYVCIKDYYLADGKIIHTKGKIYKSPCDGYINDDKGFGLSWINSCTENYFRPIKEEDWIVCEQDNVIGKPLRYKEFMSELIKKNIKSLEDKGIVPNFRLWDISDAKDGDVLYAKGSYFKEYLFMFSSFTEDNVISTHFGYDVFHGTFDTKFSRFGREEDFISVTPATKEQYDLLFQKMHEAGYEWDAEKKELKKISQRMISAEAKEAIYSKPTDLEVFINELSKQFPDVSFAKLSRIAVRVAKWDKPTDEEMKELLRTEYEKGRADTIAEMQKSTWSEEDEKISLSIEQVINCASLLNIVPEKVDKIRTWLKSLKDRVRPNKEWSEDDKKHIGDIMDYLNDYYSFAKDEDKNVADGVLNEIRWLQHI